jgi:hypothetical protein
MRGRRTMTTLRKLPMMSPNTPQVSVKKTGSDRRRSMTFTAL